MAKLYDRVKRAAFSALAIVMAGGAVPAHAGVNCDYAIITQSITYSDGRVMVLAPWRGDWVVICSLETAWKGVPPATCFGWYSKINTAIAQSKKIAFYYSDMTSADCQTMPTYSSAPAPHYVQFNGQP